jgi:hypothetical protein
VAIQTYLSAQNYRAPAGPATVATGPAVTTLTIGGGAANTSTLLRIAGSTKVSLSATQVAVTNADLTCVGAGANSERFGAGALAGSANSIAFGNAAVVNPSATARSVVIGQGASFSAAGGGVVVGGTAAATGTTATVIVGLGATVGAGATGATVVGDGASAGAGTTEGIVAIGRNATATNSSTSMPAVLVGTGTSGADGSTAVGAGATATVDGTAIGRTTTSGAGLAVGNQASCTGGGFSSQAAVGVLASSTGDHGQAFGCGATAAGSALAVGRLTSATTDRAAAIGMSTTATAADATAVGYSADATAIQTVALGANAQAVVANAVAIGYNAAVNAGTSGVALGVGTTCGHSSSVALGVSASTTLANQLHLGGITDIRGTGALTVSGVSANLTLQTVTSGNVVVASAAVVDVDGTSVTIDATGAISLDAAGASNFSVDNANLLLETTNTGDVNIYSAEGFDLQAGTTVAINATGGAISIGNDADAQAINIGTGAAARTITIGNTTGATGIVLNTGSGDITIGDGTDFVLNTTTGTKIGTSTTQKLGFWNAPPVVQSAVAAFTNNVTSGGTDDQIDNYTDLTTYANDATTIRNNLYQLGRKMDQVVDALRLYGLLG